MLHEVWDGECFVNTSLTMLGLRVQLGHEQDNRACRQKIPGPPRFIVFDVNGYHWINIDYCGCSTTASARHVQLLRAGWFPASVLRPQTVFTFDYLDTFHRLTLQGKITLHDFYLATIHKTDNLGLTTHIVKSMFST